MGYDGTVGKWEDPGKPPRGKRPNENEVIANMPDGDSVLRYQTTAPMVGMSGNVEDMALYAGQGVGLVSKMQPASEIAEVAAEVLARAGGLISR